MDIEMGTKVQIIDEKNSKYEKVGTVEHYSTHHDDYLVSFPSGFKDNYKYNQIRISK